MTNSIHEIDKDLLDREWVNQPVLFAEYAEKLANASKDLEFAKSELELVTAKLDKDIRLFPGNYGIEKLTETVITNTVILQKPYQTANTALIEARHSVNLLKAMVEGLEQRKSALENLVKLRLADYFSTPQASRDAKDKMEEDGKKSFASRTKPKPKSKRSSILNEDD